MAKEQKKTREQTKKPERKIQNMVLSESRSAKYKIVKIQQNAIIRKKKTDTASTAVQSQKQADKKPENIQKAANISGRSQRENSSASSSNKTTTPENNSGDKYKEAVKRAEVQKQFRTENFVPKTTEIKSDYSFKSDASSKSINKEPDPIRKKESFIPEKDIEQPDENKNKAKETVKRTEIQKQFRTESFVPKTTEFKSDYSFKSDASSKGINKEPDPIGKKENLIPEKDIEQPDENKNKAKEAVKRIESFAQKGAEERKRKATEINDKLKTDVIKARTETQSLENNFKSYAVENAKNSHKVKHLKKGNVDSERFSKAVNNTIKKQILRDGDYNKYKSEAGLHYKKAFSYTVKGNKVGKRLEKAEKKAARNEKVLAVGKAVATAAVLAKPEQAAKQMLEDQIRKSKLGNAVLNTNNDLQTISNAAEANSLGEGTANVVMALPEKYVKNAVKNTVTKTLTGRGKADKLGKKKKKIDRKYGAEKAKAERAERKARRAKDSAIRKAKVQFFKEEKGLTKSKSIIKNIKNGISHVVAAIGKLAIETGKSAIVAIIGALGPIVILFLAIIAVISALFSWIVPHEETFYMEESNTWEPVMMETNEEILKGYLRHIQDYFDKKQLEILEVVDINFGGFAPDKYDYNKDEKKEGALDFEDKPFLSVEYTLYHISRTCGYDTITGYTPGSKDSSPSPIWGRGTVTKSSPDNPVLRTEYYKNYEDLGYEVRTTSADFDFTRTYTLIGIDIAGYWNFKLNQNIDEDEGEKIVISCDNGVFSSGYDITDEYMTLKQDGAVIYEGSVLSYVMANPEIFEHTAPITLPEQTRNLSDKSEWVQTTKQELLENYQYVFSNYIWNLYEYQNQWIKLSESCDFEHIIALAAIKKWHEIDSEDFNSDDYTFNITDEDLDFVIDELYDFHYLFTPGECKNKDCHRYYVGGGVHYECNRALTHKHLTGQVTNLELIGGIDMVMKKVLKKPIPSDYTSTSEYDKAIEKYNTDVEIYEVYYEYIHDTLGTSTHISDYENDEAARYRLLRMYQATNGKKPSNAPKNVRCTYRHEDKVEVIKNAVDGTVWFYNKPHDYDKITEHIYLDISWDPPAPEEYAKDKYVEIKGYHVYAYDRKSGRKKLLATTANTSCSADYLWGESNNGVFPDEIEYYYIECEDPNGKTVEIPQVKSAYFKVWGLPKYTNIVITAYNDSGSGPQSKPHYVEIK